MIEVKEAKEADWDLTLKNYMASRLQFMYRRRKGNKWRQNKMYKLMNAVLKEKTDKQRLCVRFMEKCFVAYRVRLLFRKQLKYAFEKVYDIDSAKVFWYNCVTGQSTWDRPYILGKASRSYRSAAIVPGVVLGLVLVYTYWMSLPC